MSGSRWVLQGKQSQQSGLDLVEILDRISGFALASLFWIFLSLPIITMPAATAGLFAVTSAWVRGKPGELFHDFFDGMRQHWRKSTLIALLDVAVGGLVVVNLSIFRLMNMSQPLSVLSQSVTLVVGGLMLLINLYAWPMMVVFDMPVGTLLSTSLEMVFAHIGRSLLLVMGVGPLLLGLVLPVGIMIMVAFSACALVINWGAWRLIRLYVADEDLVRLEVKNSIFVRR